MYNDRKSELRFCLYPLFFLLLAGLVMVYSSSFMLAKELFNNSGYFFIKHIVFMTIGLSILFVVSKTKFSFWYNFKHWFYIVLMLLLVATLLPGLGNNLKGAHRWLSLGGFSLQPAEFLKVFVVFMSVDFFENFQKRAFKQNIKKCLLLIAPLFILIAQPDFGTFVICCLMMTFVAYLTRFPRRYFYGMVTTGLITAVLILLAAPYRVKRVLTYLDPWKDAQRSGFQIIQSYLAFAKGSLFGQGIGRSVEKLFYLPEAYNDFIFSVIGEEWGFVGVVFIVMAFVVFVFLGLKFALSCRQKIIGVFIATLTFSIGFQAFLNMGVVLGLLPTKGLNLPFISYGGSSLISNLFAVGLLFSAASWDDGENELDTVHEYDASDSKPLDQVKETFYNSQNRVGREYTPNGIPSLTLQKSVKSGFQNWSQRN